ncbi:MAG TPA: hypothetical protein VEJ46_06410 [Candidatus Acidoferrum sp.]|nr:hypothetical protein [Candidatus Acidoferrum sp.]
MTNFERHLRETVSIFPRQIPLCFLTFVLLEQTPSAARAFLKARNQKGAEIILQGVKPLILCATPRHVN